jgi:hypothetical protein
MRLLPASLPLLSTCRLALALPECRLCLFSDNVRSGYSPPAIAPSVRAPSSGWFKGTAIGGLLSSGDLGLLPLLWCCVGTGSARVEFEGFQRLVPVPCRSVRIDIALVSVLERLRLKGEGYPPPMSAVRRLQRVGLLTRTCGCGEGGIGEGEGYVG